VAQLTRREDIERRGELAEVEAIAGPKCQVVRPSARPVTLTVYILRSQKYEDVGGIVALADRKSRIHH
jgi:hypothetical protein